MKKIARKILLVVMAVVLVISGSSCKDEEKCQEFYDVVNNNGESISLLASLVCINWYDAIHNKKFSGDINEAVNAALEDNAWLIDVIETRDKEVTDKYKKAKDSKLKDLVKEVMQCYNDYYSFVMDVRGSYLSFSQGKDEKKQALTTALRNLEIEL